MENNTDHRPDTLLPPAQQITHDRDALIRLHLANQRTVLSYLRTALTFFVAGVSFIHFFESLIVEILGWVFVPIGVVTFVVGVWRYNLVRVRMRHIGQRLYRRSPIIPR